jgi:hypothetical protein
MRRKLEMMLMAMLCGMAGCSAVPNAHRVKLQDPDAQRVVEGLEKWPRPAKGAAVKRPFFATIHAAGTRTTASGMLEYYGPHDFRLTAVTEMGVILFDGRVNWAGVTVLRQMPGLDKGVIETLLEDLARGFDVPAALDGIKAGDSRMILERKLGDTHKYSWIFDRDSGRLRETDVELGFLDTLHINFNGYTAQGWPGEMTVVRKARLYDVAFTFTDSPVVEGTATRAGGMP